MADASVAGLGVEAGGSVGADGFSVAASAGFAGSGSGRPKSVGRLKPPVAGVGGGGGPSLRSKGKGRRPRATVAANTSGGARSSTNVTWLPCARASRMITGAFRSITSRAVPGANMAARKAETLLLPGAERPGWTTPTKSTTSRNGSLSAKACAAGNGPSAVMITRPGWLSSAMIRAAQSGAAHNRHRINKRRRTVPWIRRPRRRSNLSATPIVRRKRRPNSVLPRCGSTGCIWPTGRNGRGCRS